MSKTTLIIVSAAGLLLAFLVCAGFGAVIYRATLAPQIMETNFAQTMSVALTQTAQSQFISPIVQASNTPPPTVTPPITFTPGAPTITPSATATLPPAILFTPTPSVPQISVYVDTNCRVGPGKVYDRVGYLLVGQVSEIYGRNPAGNYWYIRNLNKTTDYCWLWGEYATVSGNLSALPVYTPPPTPTPMPNFAASFAGEDTCCGKDGCTGWWVDIRLENTGGITFRSMTLTVRDTDTEISQTLYSNGFTDNDGCTDTVTYDSLSPGGRRIVSSPAFAYDLSDHELRATITLCSNTNQSGTCITEVIEFEP